ncbi:hypothetical protein QJS04_geneDACA022311 [Acorus gramineus]|uniref:Uncharacterized protein n=1 Tax=Acorus gramineus TaxID=55184 RepID=A0AAV9B9T4_ACOGR|nr:hypothetical protein QJS04_geneDACA022311 [Acorus gramineus]
MLCVDRRCLVFQIRRCDTIPSALSDFLSDTRFTFTGIDVREKVQRLILDYEVSVGNVRELKTWLEEVERERGRLRRERLQLAKDILMLWSHHHTGDPPPPLMETWHCDPHY